MPITDSKPTSDNPQTQAPQNVQYAAPYPQQFEDDTINLYELWIILWNRKWLVIVVTVIAALGSVVYALQQPSVYKAEALLLPPRVEDLKSLNFPGVPVTQMVEPKGGGLKGAYGIGVNAVFEKFKKNLSSRSLQKKFIEEHGLMDILAPNRTPETRVEDIHEGFAGLIELRTTVKGMTYVSMEWDYPEFPANLINNYIRYFDLVTIKMLVSAARNSIESQIRDIKSAISSKREMAKVRRLDRIVVIKEAANTAFLLGIKDRVDTTNVVQNNQLNISVSNTPLYYRGFKALNAEIEFLENRISDDPFISGLRDQQEKLTLLRSIKIDKEGMHSVTVDQAAYPPKNHFKPDRKLIVSLGTVVGLFLGIFLVFFVSFIQKQKETHSE